MNKILFENRYFKSEKNDREDIVVTILQDNHKLLDIDMTGCKLITTKEGFIADEYTENVLKSVNDIFETEKERNNMLLSLRHRLLNSLMSFL